MTTSDKPPAKTRTARKTPPSDAPAKAVPPTDVPVGETVSVIETKPSDAPNYVVLAYKGLTKRGTYMVFEPTPGSEVRGRLYLPLNTDPSPVKSRSVVTRWFTRDETSPEEDVSFE